MKKTVANAAPVIKTKMNNPLRIEDDQEKDEKRVTKTGAHDHESPRELERQSEAQRMLAPQSEANVYRHNPKKSRPFTAQDTQQKLRVAFSYV